MSAPNCPAPLLWTPSEAALHLRVSLRSVWRLLKGGRLPRECTTYVGSQLRFRRQALEDWLAAGGGRPQGPPPAA
jgi:excisionase family DNA binding protein